MAITRQVITSLERDGTDMLGTKNVAVKIVDESIVSGSLLTVESNHFCILKSRGAVLNVYETGQYALTTPDKPLIGSIAQGFFGGNSPWVYEVIYINRSKLLVSDAASPPAKRWPRWPTRSTTTSTSTPRRPRSTSSPICLSTATSSTPRKWPTTPVRRSSSRSTRSCRSPRWKTSTSISANCARR